MNIPIIVVAYNRENSLERLLNSLNQAHYDNHKVDLIISIDKSDNDLVYEVAYKFEWLFGEKRILKQQKNMGLREHILKCGDLALENDAIIMLEDDLVVSKSFYRYARQSVSFYNLDPDIAGISLYAYRIAEPVNRPFIPFQDESDSYFMKVPSSWGQIWTKEHWGLFREWYDINNAQRIDIQDKVPQNVYNWPETSWKKYFYFYLVENNKYIVYPRISLSTNMGDIGTHFTVIYKDYQTLLMGDFNRDYNFKSLKDSIAIYDAFFENEHIVKHFGLDEPLTVNYFGTKEGNTRYLLTTKKLNFKIINGWGLSLIPYELNIYNDVFGEDLLLYDLSEFKKNNQKNNMSTIFKYELPGLSKEKALYIAFNEYKYAIQRKIKKVLSKVNNQKE